MVRVTESVFMRMFMPTCHAALAAHAMYYGEGDYANRRLSIKKIAAALHCEPQNVHDLLDLADSMLADASQMMPHPPHRAERYQGPGAPDD